MEQKAGLVLEGGGMRGIYTAGVLDWLDDHGVLFHRIIGVSAGACNAVSYISGQRGRNAQINLSYSTDRRYLSKWGLLTRGSVFGMDFIFNRIPNEFVPFDYDTYRCAGCDFEVVCTDALTGKPFYFHSQGETKRLNTYLMASSSIPIAAKPVRVDGRVLFDGGVADSIPVERSVCQGNDVHLIVLTRNKGYRKPKDRFVPLYRLRYPHYPRLVDAMAARSENYNHSLEVCEQLEREGKAIVLRPSRPVEIDKFEKSRERLEALYRMGYADASAAGEKILCMAHASENVSVREKEHKGEMGSYTMYMCKSTNKK